VIGFLMPRVRHGRQADFRKNRSSRQLPDYPSPQRSERP